MKNLALNAITLALASTLVGCLGLDKISVDSISASMLQTGDQNKDGQLDQAEFIIAFRDAQPCLDQTCSAEFQMADVNQDNIVSAEEVRGFVVKTLDSEN